MKNQSNIIAPLEWYKNKKWEHTHWIYLLNALLYAVHAQYVVPFICWRRCSRRKHLANFHFTCANSMVVTTYGFVYMYVLCTRYEYVVSVSVSSTAILHTHSSVQLRVCWNLCANTTIWRQRFRQKPARKKFEPIEIWNNICTNRKTSAVKCSHRKWREKLILYNENETQSKGAVVVFNFMREKNGDSWTHQ